MLSFTDLLLGLFTDRFSKQVSELVKKDKKYCNSGDYYVIFSWNILN